MLAVFDFVISQKKGVRNLFLIEVVLSWQNAKKVLDTVFSILACIPSTLLLRARALTPEPRRGSRRIQHDDKFGFLCGGVS